MVKLIFAMIREKKLKYTVKEDCFIRYNKFLKLNNTMRILNHRLSCWRHNY